jgi:hypothetical protein
LQKLNCLVGEREGGSSLAKWQQTPPIPHNDTRSTIALKKRAKKVERDSEEVRETHTRAPQL